MVQCGKRLWFLVPDEGGNDVFVPALAFKEAKITKDWIQATSNGICYC